MKSLVPQIFCVCVFVCVFVFGLNRGTRSGGMTALEMVLLTKMLL